MVMKGKIVTLLTRICSSHWNKNGSKGKAVTEGEICWTWDNLLKDGRNPFYSPGQVKQGEKGSRCVQKKSGSPHSLRYAWCILKPPHWLCSAVEMSNSRVSLSSSSFPYLFPSPQNWIRYFTRIGGIYPLNRDWFYHIRAGWPCEVSHFYVLWRYCMFTVLLPISVGTEGKAMQHGAKVIYVVHTRKQFDCRHAQPFSCKWFVVALQHGTAVL